MKQADTPITIAIAEMLTESTCFNPVLMTRRDFEAECLLYGDDIIPYARTKKQEFSGFLEGVDKFGKDLVSVVPILKARGMPPGGPVERDLYEDFKKTVIDGLKKIENLDGVYLAMHGTMGVDGMFDPEGDLLATVRREFGPDIPVAVSLDMHATVTRKMADNATLIVGYKTNPHRDFKRVGKKCAELLIKTIRGEIRPTMAFRKLRILKGGGICIDLLRPMRPIFRRMKKMEKMNRVLSVSNFTVHLWSDDPETGWATIAVTDDDPELAGRLADEIADLDWEVRNADHGSGKTPSEAIGMARRMRLRRRLGHISFSDVSDGVGAGAPGDNTWILKALMEEAPDLVTYIPIKDEEVAAELFESGRIGDTVTVTVGGKVATVYNSPVKFTGELILRVQKPKNKVVVLRHQGIHLIVAELPAMTFFPDYYTNLGLSLLQADIVVVKSLFHFRWYFKWTNRKTIYVVTWGCTNVNVHENEYEHIPRPIHPLDPVDSWRPEDN
jgi:microcystin degradation protein MlrC